MHVMEDVEEAFNVPGTLPSSPGHAEEHPEPIKTVENGTTPNEITTPTEENGEKSEEKPEEEKVDNEKSESKRSEESEKEEDKDVVIVNSEPESPIPVVEPTENKTSEDVKNENEEIVSNGSAVSDSQPEKRKSEDEESPAKRLRSQIQQEYLNHDKILADYISRIGCNNVDELQEHMEQLLAEVKTLNEMAKEKEREWNNILHLKKVKEELLLRLQRKKQVLLISGDKIEVDGDAAIDLNDSDSKGTEATQNLLKQCSLTTASGLMMVPIVSSSPTTTYATLNNGVSEIGREKYQIMANRPRSILPKPMSGDYGAQNDNRAGRQGPTVDVRSIIADYRQRHPENVPRRGRRMKSVLNNSQNDTNMSNKQMGGVLSMASLTLGSGSHVRHGNMTNNIPSGNELGILLSAIDSQSRQENSRPSSTDSSSAQAHVGVNDPPPSTLSFKDVLVQFARLSQSERQELQAQVTGLQPSGISKPPPPYPEVTLHPVPAAPNPPPTPPTNSLLHGILTKTQPRQESKPTTFSPTLARLLTAPERSQPVMPHQPQTVYTSTSNSGVSITDLLSNNKARNEITITPVGEYGPSSKGKEDSHMEEEEAEDSADRLVIDEGMEGGDGRGRMDNGSEGSDEVPQCQGCHQRAAQFVCAGCGNQWYCSRDCQVTAWDEHSEVCSG